MSLPPDAVEHPGALAEGLAIASSGSWSHRKALGEFSAVLDSLFDGPGDPAYVGSSRRVEDIFYEYPQQEAVRVFARRFWGDDGAGIIAVICVKGDRPVLMSVVAIGLNRTEESEAESLALKNAILRLSDF